MFANAQAQSSSLLVAILAVAHHVKLDEKFFLISQGDTSSTIFNYQLKSDII